MNWWRGAFGGKREAKWPNHSCATSCVNSSSRSTSGRARRRRPSKLLWQNDARLEREITMSSVLRTPSSNMLVDVVDGEDRKIGEAPREHVLSAALNFHTVHLFLFDASGRLLLQQLAAKRKRHPL